MKTYAAYYMDDVRRKSSSGGIFSLVASCFDVVYGVSMSKDCYSCEYIRTLNDLSGLRGSKYIQANMGDVYSQVIKDVKDGKKVLFSGTGCQINGLASLLGRDYDNLFLIDVVCHGVPSKRLWEKYIKSMEEKNGKLVGVNFRTKTNEKCDLKKRKRILNAVDQDPYMKLFLSNECLRPSCYECYAKRFKKSDMTVGDFWGIDKLEPGFDDGNGTSLVIVRTEKGLNLLNLIDKKIKCKEVRYEDGVKFNSCEYESVSKPQERDGFYLDLDLMQFDEVVDKYIKYEKLSIWSKIKKEIKIIIGKMLVITNVKCIRPNAYFVLYEFEK